MGISTTTGNKFLDHILSTSSWTMPSACYISLHTADPGTTGADEVTGGSYVRQGDTAMDAASSLTADNTNAISFTSMPAETVTHVGIWDSETDGEFLCGGSLAASKTTDAGDTLTISAGDLDVTAS